MVVQVIARVLRTLLEGIAALDAKITEAAEAHPDFFIFQSFPGAGAALALRWLAALGSQRDRYASAEEVQKYSGIAPAAQRPACTFQRKRSVRVLETLPTYDLLRVSRSKIHKQDRTGWLRL
jgi:hypothetical protein